MELTVEQILKIKHGVEEHERIVFPMCFNYESNNIIEDTKFIKLFYELKEWFKGWNIKETYYVTLMDNPHDERDKNNGRVIYGNEYNPEFKETENFFKENYELLVLIAIFGIHLGMVFAFKGDHDSDMPFIEMIDYTFTFMFDQRYMDEDSRKLYTKYSEIFNSINNYKISKYYQCLTRGMIRNKMKEDTEEAFLDFLREYYNILKKYSKNIPLIENDVIKIAAPTYQVAHRNPNQDIIDTYGYVPAAVQALQQNPMGLWYYDQQSSMFRSKFVDYSKLDNCHDQKAVKLYIERITRVMSMPKVYQMILQEMPELGTDINGNTIKFKIAGYNSTKIGLLAVKDDKHVLAIIYDNAEDKAQGISGDRKNVDAWIVKKLAD